jgi:hypothetical protein
MKRADLADLTAFGAVADHLSFRTAASRLGVTPSALSHSDAAAGGAYRNRPHEDDAGLVSHGTIVMPAPDADGCQYSGV